MHSLHRVCGTPHCGLPDYHAGPCASEHTGTKRPAAAPVARWEPFNACHWQARAKINKAKREKSRRIAKPDELQPGQEHRVERLLGIRRRGPAGEFVYAVRWEGTSDKQDTWDPAENIDPTLISEFLHAPLLRAPWGNKVRGNAPPTYLIESILERRAADLRDPDRPAQSKVRWLGFAKKWDTWIADEAIIQPDPNAAVSATEVGVTPLATPSVARPSASAQAASSAAASSAATAPTAAAKAAAAMPPPPPADEHANGMDGVRALLVDFRLEQYADKFDELGYDDCEYLCYLRVQEPQKFADVLEKQIGMKKGHAAKLLHWWSGDGTNGKVGFNMDVPPLKQE
jgi:hypothetical protein